MHPLNNGSQDTQRPANKPSVGSPGYFTESGENNVPSYPGADWFNNVIDEFMSALDLADCNFDPLKYDNLANAIRTIASNVSASFESVSKMIDLDSTSGAKIKLSPGVPYHLSSYFTGELKGGGTFIYSPTIPKNFHDGGMIISPTVPFNGQHNSLPNFLDGIGEEDPDGLGVFVRILGDYETPEMYGALRDGISDDIYSIVKCDATCPSRHIKYTSGVYAIGAHPDHPQGFSPVRDRTTHEGVGFSWTSETGLTVWKYIGPVNDVFAVLKLSRGDIGADVSTSRNYNVKHLKLDANARAGFGLYENYASNDSFAENIVVINSRYRAVHVVKSWYNNMKDVVAYNNYGSGMSFGIPLDDLIPGTTEMLDVNGFGIVNPRAHSNGRQLPDESLTDWQNRRFDESAGRIANWGIGIGFVHGYIQKNPASEYNYGPGIYRTNALGSDTRGLVSESGYVERNCNQAIMDGTATDYWGFWHDGDNSSTRGELVIGLWFNPTLSASASRVKIAGTPKSSNPNELISFVKCPNISIPDPEHDQFGNDSDSGGLNMPNPYSYAYQCMGVSSTALTLRDARDGTSFAFGMMRYDNSPSSDNLKAFEFLPRSNAADVGLRVARNETTPGDDNQSTSGSAARRWTQVYAVNGTINTSDRNEKTGFKVLPESFVDVLCDIANSIQLWKWKESVEEKR